MADVSKTTEELAAADNAATDPDYHDVADRIPLGIFELCRDPSGDWVPRYVNRRFCEILDVVAEDVLAGVAARLDRVHPHDRDRALGTMTDALEKGADFALETRVIVRGQNRWMRAELKAYPEGSEFTTWVGIVEDVSEKRRVAQALIEGEQRFRAALANKEPTAFIMDSELRYTWVHNPAAPLTPESVLGKTDYDLVPRHEAESVVRMKRRVLQTGVGERGVVRLSVDRETAFLDLAVEPLRGAGGRIVGVGGASFGIAHDFNNILTGIMGNLSLAKAEVDAGSRLRLLLDESEAACETASALSRQLLTFAKEGRPVVRLTALPALIRQASTFAARGSSSHCLFDIDEGLHLVEMDREQLAQVVQNLVLNASQAMETGGTIRISASNAEPSTKDVSNLAPGQYVRIDVADDGIGIAAWNISKIFDPYFSTKASGRGLGLSVCHSIVEMHGGHIDVESELGVGTTFSFYIPAQTAATLETDPETGPLESGNRRVLIMDDDALIIATLTRILTKLGYEVESVADGTGALQAYEMASQEGREFDLVIMDLTIPGGMGGEETIKELRKRYPNLNAIVSSGYSNDPVLSEYDKHGFRGVLTKPYSLGDVAKVLSEVLAAH